MAEKKSLAVSTSLAVAVVGLAILSYFFPLFFPLMLAGLIPLTAYLGLRVKIIGFPLAAVAVLTAACLVNRLYMYLFLPFYFFGTVGVMAGIGKELKQCFYWSVAGMLIGALLLPLVAFWSTGKNIPEAAEAVVETSESPAVLAAARRAEYDWRISKLDKNSEHYSAEAAAIHEEIAAMPENELLKRFAADVRNFLYRDSVAILCTLTPLYAVIAMFGCSLLIKLFQQNFSGAGVWLVKNDVYRAGRFIDFELPKGYFLGTFPVVVLFFLLGFQFDYCRILFSGLYPFLLLVPFGAAGLAAAVYVVVRNGRHYWLAALVALVLLALFPLLPVIGLTDYFIHFRKLIKLLDETDNI